MLINTRRIVFPLFFLMAAALAFQISCSMSQRLFSDDVDANRRLWQKNGISNYRMKVDLQKTGHATPMGVFIITVRGGVTESIKLADDPDFALSREMFEKYDTIDKIFSVVESGEKDLVEFECDPNFGYPKRVRIDDPNVLDEEFLFRMLEFEALQ